MPSSKRETFTSLCVQFPAIYGHTNYKCTSSITTLPDADGKTVCMKASISGIDNPAAFLSAGPFALWTITTSGVMRDANWNFGTIGFGPEVQEFARVEP